jgi:hypothetical protein
MRIYWVTKMKILALQNAQLEIIPRGEIDFCGSKPEQKGMDIDGA